MTCDCFTDGLHRWYCSVNDPDLVPGYADSADGQADAADQARQDAK